MDNQPIQPTPPIPSPNHSSKTFLLILGTITLMVVSALGGYYLGSNKERQPSQTINQYAQPSPTIAPKRESTGSAISPAPNGDRENWKTYSNGYFIIKFPNTWIREKQPEQVGGEYLIYNPSTMFRHKGGLNPPEEPSEYLRIISITVTPKTASQDAVEEEKKWQEINPSLNLNRESYVKDGTEYEIYDGLGGNAGPGRTIEISNGKILIIISSSIKYPSGNDVESQILSTFKFTP